MIKFCFYLTSAATLMLPVFHGPDAIAAASERRLVLNPYESVDWERAGHHKGNFHCHTTVSDGRGAPHQMVDEYRRQGFTVLTLSDHHGVTFPWTEFDQFEPSALARRRAADGRIDPLEEFQNRDPDELGMVAIPGGELAANHDYLSLFSDFAGRGDDLDTLLTDLGNHSDRGLSILPHPALHWPRDFGPKPGIRVPLTPALRQVTRGDFSVEAWFRVVDSSRSVLLGNHDAGREGVLNLKIQTWINEVRLTLRPGSGGERVDMLLPADEFGIRMRDREWHHVAAVRREGMIYVYLNGVELGSHPDTAKGFDLEGEELYIGRDARVGVTKFNGDIDNLRLWTRGLTPDEVSMLALENENATFPERTGLLAEYLFEPNGESPEASDFVADTASHAEGPFHGEVMGGGFHTENVAHPLRAAGLSTRAMSFDFPYPESVYPAAVEFYKGLFDRHTHLIGVEVVNGSRARRDYGLDRELWDRLLIHFMPDRPVWGFAHDDAHTLGSVGRDWIVFPLGDIDLEPVRTAMLSGAFYFPTVQFNEGEPAAERTPLIDSIVHDQAGGILTIQASVEGEPLQDDAYRWIADGEEVATGPTLNYRTVEGIGGYVRAEMTGSGGITHTNPFGFKSGNE